MTIQEILAAQKRACDAARKVRPQPKPAPENNSVAEIIARQKAAVAAQKAARDARAAANAFGANTNVNLTALKNEYQAWLAEHAAEFENLEPMFFTPNLPQGTEATVVNVAADNGMVNGISMGSEVGGEAVIMTKPAPVEPEESIEPVEEVPVSVEEPVAPVEAE